MRHLDLFSGIGGFALAASWVWGPEHEIVAFCEIDKYCRKVLQKHWPRVPIIEDIRNVTAKALSDIAALQRKAIERSKPDGNLPVDEIGLLTGGFPCQPFSCAGKRSGSKDDRFLWPEMLRVIKETRPRFILAENVPGIIRMELDNCLSALEAEGYACGTLVIPACAVNAPHRRDRVWIVAHSMRKGSPPERTTWTRGETGSSAVGSSGFVAHSEIRAERAGLCEGESRGQRRGRSCYSCSADASDSSRIGLEGGGSCESGKQDRQASRGGRFTECGGEDDSDSSGKRLEDGAGLLGSGTGTYPSIEALDNWTAEPDVGRVAHGVPSRVDRLRALGNAIVPQVAAVIMRAIKEAECQQK